jgi:hypothetical protein
MIPDSKVAPPMVNYQIHLKILDSKVVPTILDNKPTPTILDNKPTPTIPDNKPTPTIPDSKPTPTIPDSQATTPTLQICPVFLQMERRHPRPLTLPLLRLPKRATCIK